MCSYIHTQTTASKIWTYKSSITRPINVVFVDLDYKVMIPESVQFVNNNQIKVVYLDRTSKTVYASVTFGQASSELQVLMVH